MKPSIAFFAQGDPKGQPRPRAFARGGRAHVYDPATAEGWKSQIAASAKDHIPLEPWTEPIVLTLTFVMPRPKGHYRTGKRASELRPDAPHWHTAKPDCDNLAKAVMDTLTTLGFWRDDQQVCGLSVKKRYGGECHAGLMPGCFITMEEAFEL